MRRRTVKQKACLFSKMIYRTLRFVNPGPVTLSAEARIDPASDEGHAAVSAQAGEKRLFGMHVEHRNGRLVFVK